MPRLDLDLFNHFYALSQQFRLFIYGGFGVSALIGGVTSLTQLAASELDWYTASPAIYAIDEHEGGKIVSMLMLLSPPRWAA